MGSGGVRHDVQQHMQQATKDQAKPKAQRATAPAKQPRAAFFQSGALRQAGVAKDTVVKPAPTTMPTA
uniref:Uncharacterized protein n=1 Tax=Romanomermis culicivorax TaxID=13658 RepID=A0A915J6A2_ROMCU